MKASPGQYPWYHAGPPTARGSHPVGSAPPDDETTLVRPYMVTGGRTRPLQDGLRVETVVNAAPAALHAPLKFEPRRIVELCQTPRSIAELAVALAMPLGVVRVLVADLITANVVVVQATSDVTTEMLERIIDRVRAL